MYPFLWRAQIDGDLRRLFSQLLYVTYVLQRPPPTLVIVLNRNPLFRDVFLMTLQWRLGVARA